MTNLVKARIQLKSNLPYESALEFWSKSLNIPKSSFYKPLIFPKKENNTRVCQFGSAELRINSALAFKLITYWTQVLLVSRI